jgi:hypothetical protein
MAHASGGSVLAVLAILSLAAALSSSAVAEEAAVEFSGFNPSLHWSYGWSASPGAAFNAFTAYGTATDGVSAWTGPGQTSISRNCTGFPQQQYGRTLPIGSLCLRPGAGGEQAVLRWTAPASGSYRLNATFKGLGGYTSLPDWTLPGSLAFGHVGYSVASAGDVNGDGYADVIVGEPSYSNGQSSEGRARLYLGSGAGLSTTAAWSFESDTAGYVLGWSVASARDVNADGYDDVIVGVQGLKAAFVFYGSASGLSPTVSWRAQSSMSGRFGSAVAGAGDVNGDGYDDILVGDDRFTNGDTFEGRAYLWLGGAGGLGPAGTLANADWYTPEPNQVGALLGFSVASAGDVNGDGYADVIVGAYGKDNGTAGEGLVYVFHGSPTGPSPNADWFGESNRANSEFGFSVAGAGDVNGDGYGDVIVGAYTYSNGQSGEGSVFVWLGSVTGLGASGNPANADWSAEANLSTSLLGYSVAGAGDVNGDGFDDILAGSEAYSNGQAGEGAAFMWLGSAAGLGANGTPLNADWNAEGNKLDAQFGFVVAGGGDVNGDSRADLLVGAPYWDTTLAEAGQAYAYLNAAPPTQPPATTAAAIFRNSNQIASGWINLNGAGNSATFVTDQVVSTGESIDFTLGDGGNGRDFDHTVLDVIITPTVDLNGPAYSFMGQRFVPSLGGPGMDGAAFDPVNRRIATAGKIYDLCGTLVSDGPQTNVGVSWDPVGQKLWELIDDNANARWVMRRWNGAVLQDTVFTLPRLITVLGTGADTIEDVRGIALDSSFVYLVDAGPQVEPRRNAWIKLTRDGTPIKSREYSAFAVNTTNDIVDDIVYAPFSSPMAPGRLLVEIEHSGLMAFDIEGNLVSKFLWSEQFITKLERPSAAAGLTLDPATGNLYLVDNDTGRMQVWTRLPDSGPTTYVLGTGGEQAYLQLPIPTCNLPLWSPIAPLSCSPQSLNVFGIAYRPASNRVFGCEYNSGDLWRFDPRSGRGVFIGNTGAMNVWGMGYDVGRDALYGHSQTDGHIYAINPNTGVGTALPNAMGFSATDLAFIPGDGHIYAVNKSQVPARLIRIDRDTGSGVVVGPTVAVSGLDWDEIRGRLVGAGGGVLYAINAGTGTSSQIALLPNNIGWEGLAVIPVAPAATVDVAEEPPAAASVALRAWPNPFRDGVAFHIVLSTTDDVEVRVVDVAGRLVRHFETRHLSPGEHALRWDGRDGAGARSPGGMYFVRVRSGSQMLTAKAILLE